MKYQFLSRCLLYVPLISRRMRKMTAMNRKKDVIRAKVLRVRVARLSCGFVSSGWPCSTAVAAEFSDRRRPKRPMLCRTQRRRATTVIAVKVESKNCCCETRLVS
jgi:hypothetical protein